MALPAARVVSRQGDSGSGSGWRSIRCEDTQQAGVRAGRKLAGVCRPRGATVLRTVGRTDELTERKTLSVALSSDTQR